MDFTAVVKQNNATVASTTHDAVYTIRDGWCTAHFEAAITAAGTTNTEIKVTPTGLPLPASGSISGTAYEAGKSIGQFFYADSGTGYYVGRVQFDGTDIKFIQAGGNNALGQSPNFATANGDELAFTIIYRIL